MCEIVVSQRESVCGCPVSSFKFQVSLFYNMNWFMSKKLF
ncbi:Uncharacterized protein dnm_053330 [Desulfonema magnum]|uniref:Uncharacterized protein n=1 Tax=Desulfonema magnum TaxID=45655 RepID=A0A975BQ19_9BACT|nr:Uncharacterized protein dnm_053330 [Desulfonema magnum]